MTSQTITVSGWTSLGSGPMLIETNNTCGVWLIDAASQPDVSVLRGSIYLESGKELPISPAGTLWALPGQGAATASVGVDPQAAESVSDTSYATHAAVQCLIIVTNAATGINSLLTTANTADSTKCPIAAVPDWATAAFIQPYGAMVNFTTNAGITLAVGSPGTGFPIAAGQPFPIQGKASIDLLRLIAAASTPVSLNFMG